MLVGKAKNRPSFEGACWPFSDPPAKLDDKNNNKKWLVTCAEGEYRPWQVASPAEPYLAGYVKSAPAFQINTQYRDSFNVFAAAQDREVLQQLARGNPPEGGGHGICLLGVVVDVEGKIKRWIFHDPYGDQTQHPTVEGYYGGDNADVDREGTKGAYAPYGPEINSLKDPDTGIGNLMSTYALWFLNPQAPTVANIRPRLLASEPPNALPPP
jgi:hypothetical protein